MNVAERGIAPLGPVVVTREVQTLDFTTTRRPPDFSVVLLFC